MTFFLLAAFACTCAAVVALLALDRAGHMRLDPSARAILRHATTWLAVVVLATAVAAVFLTLTASPAGGP